MAHRNAENIEINRDTDGDNVDASSACSHRFIPCQRRIVRVAVRQNHEVIGHIRSVSVSRLKHHVCRETDNKRQTRINCYTVVRQVLIYN